MMAFAVQVIYEVMTGNTIGNELVNDWGKYW
jgi:hypothetical protein